MRRPAGPPEQPPPATKAKIGLPEPPPAAKGKVGVQILQGDVAVPMAKEPAPLQIDGNATLTAALNRLTAAVQAHTVAVQANTVAVAKFLATPSVVSSMAVPAAAPMVAPASVQASGTFAASSSSAAEIPRMLAAPPLPCPAVLQPLKHAFETAFRGEC